MKATELRELNNEGLQEKLDGLKSQLFSLRGQAVTEKIENVMASKNLKKDIARIKTIIKERELKGL